MSDWQTSVQLQAASDRELLHQLRRTLNYLHQDRSVVHPSIRQGYFRDAWSLLAELERRHGLLSLF